MGIVFDFASDDLASPSNKLDMLINQKLKHGLILRCLVVIPL